MIITRSHSSASTSAEQVAKGSDVVPSTPAQGQSAPGSRYVLVSPTLGPITVEQLLKGNSDNVAKIRRKYDEERLTCNLPQSNNQINLNLGDSNAERNWPLSSELSTLGLALDSVF